jgi:hypothetical protein
VAPSENTSLYILLAQHRNLLCQPPKSLSQALAMKLLISASLVASALALPSSNSVKPRASVADPLQLESALKGLTDEPSALNFFSNIVPAPAPTSIAQELAGIKQVVSPHPKDIFQSGAEILAAGFAGGDYVTIANAYLFQSSTKNFNLRQPLVPVYPKAGPLDAPYSLTEKQLREVIYIPPDFTYGRRPPVIFLPGSGAVAGQNFGPNYGKLFKAQDVADPVYLNLPGQNLADIQVAAEYTAYAINYISAISGGKKVSVTHVIDTSTMLTSSKGEHHLLVRRLPRQPMGIQVLALDPRQRRQQDRPLRRLSRHRARQTSLPRLRDSRLHTRRGPAKLQQHFHSDPA